MKSTIYENRLLVCLVFLVAWAYQPVQATTVSTPAFVAVYAFQSCLSKCLASGIDVNQVTMEQIAQHLRPKFADRITSRFELLSGRGPIDHDSNERMIALMSYQVSEDRRPSLGRYVIWEKDGEIRNEWVAEDRLKSLLDAAGLPVTNKGVWKQPDVKGKDLFHVPRVVQEPDNQIRALDDVTGYRHDVSNELIHINKAQAISKTESQSLLSKSKSWLFLSLFVVAAAVGVSWLLLRKAKA